MFVLSVSMPSCKQSFQLAGSQQHLQQSSVQLLVAFTADVSPGSNPQASRGQAHPTNNAAAMRPGPHSSLEHKVAAAGRLVADVAGPCLLCCFCGVEWRHSAWRQGCSCTSPTPHAAAVFCAVYCSCPGSLPFRHCQVSTAVGDLLPAWQCHLMQC